MPEYAFVSDCALLLCAQLIAEEKFGYAVAMIQDKVSENLLADVAGKTKFVPKDDQMVQAARDLDISFGD